MISLTGHVLIKNEENFVHHAINSILPFCEKVIVWDTGSNDNTIEWIPKHEKITVIRHNNYKAGDLTLFRNNMIGMTGTTHFFVCDGDELYNTTYMQKIIPKIDMDTDLVRVMRADMYLYHAHQTRQICRIFRVRGSKWTHDYPNEYVEYDHDPPKYQEFTEEIGFWHYTNFPRSQRRVSFDYRRKKFINKAKHVFDRISGRWN